MINCGQTACPVLVNRKCKLVISTAPMKAKLQEPAYSTLLNQNKTNRQRVMVQEVGQLDSSGVYSLKLE